MTYHYHGIDAEESILTKSLPNLGTWALPNLFSISLYFALITPVDIFFKISVVFIKIIVFA